ncbi:YesL family protein [Halalkalibacter sp. APA_J-10(15)]|uniref:YesL family protein n=1 Tax=unclassified Halalkalibacter TaxID=2893063 RepID=UPI001FF62142|nr:DUF624 domain-containing protein [Halalkalibacter sp. APA_J-10(15)]MCK0471999.1 DUF624 domain-containing protein [Halalkalibacter sp. APA_J-10(15)]
MKGVSEWYIRLGNMALNLFLLNILWLLFTVLGLVVITIFPATAALFSVTRDFILKTDQSAIFKPFLHSFKKEFLRANLIGYIFSFVGILLFVNLYILQQLDYTFFHLSLTVITLLICLIFSLSALMIFPVLIHYDLKVWRYFQYAVFITIGRPLHSIMLLLGVAAIFFLFLKIPGLIPVFGVSLMALLIMKIASLSFPHNKQPA